MIQLFSRSRASVLASTLCCGCLLASLAGCGQMGPLYQPPPEQAAGNAQGDGGQKTAGAETE